MRRLHFAAGVIVALVFVLTGQVMSHHMPPMSAVLDGTRLLFRSRHIYILAGGLVNLMLGLYYAPLEGWRRIVQSVGGALFLTAPVLLVLAFFTEPGRGFQEDMPLSALGQFALFGGGMLHLVSRLGRPLRKA